LKLANVLFSKKQKITKSKSKKNFKSFLRDLQILIWLSELALNRKEIVRVESINVDVHDKTKNFVESFNIKVEVDEKNKKIRRSWWKNRRIDLCRRSWQFPNISSNRSISKSKLKSMKKQKNSSNRCRSRWKQFFRRILVIIKKRKKSNRCW
jgi:hypothetical protein